jgi:hypothetical protein
MTVFTVNDTSITIQKPTILFPSDTVFWNGKAKVTSSIQMGSTRKYYTTTVLQKDQLYGYTIDPELHTLRLMFKNTIKEFLVEFETQDEYDSAVKDITALF